jgi:hypothetical protein
MLKIDNSDFVEAMKLYKEATNKDCVDILNRAGKNTAIKTHKLTKRTTAARIAAELNSGSWYGGRLKYAIIASRLQGKVPRGEWRKAVGEAAEKMVAARRASAGYLRVAVMAAGKAFGAFSNSKTPGGFAADSKGEKAKATRLEARLQVSVPDAAAGFIDLEAGVEAAAVDMATHAKDQLSKTAKKYSSSKAR